jgi:hypothetical protein
MRAADGASAAAEVDLDARRRTDRDLDGARVD